MRQAGSVERNQRLKPSNDIDGTESPAARYRPVPTHHFATHSRCVGVGQPDLARPAIPSSVMGIECASNPTTRLDAPYRTTALVGGCCYQRVTSLPFTSGCVAQHSFDIGQLIGRVDSHGFLDVEARTGNDALTIVSKDGGAIGQVVLGLPVVGAQLLQGRC